MANIKNLTMGSLLLSDPRITTVNTLFGLSSKAVYVPTGSKISSCVYEYSAQEEDKLKHLLPLTGAALADAARNVKTLKSHDIGNLRLEVCVSADHQFAAMQLFRYSNIVATPVTSLSVYEQADAATVAGLL